MPSTLLLDACGRRRSPATLSSFHQGRPPRNKGQRYPADPPTVEEIISVMHAAGEDNEALRLRGLIVVLWRAGLRISEALALTESDLDVGRGAILVRHGKGGKRREVGMDRWAWEQLGPWLQLRTTLPVGALFCVLRGPTAGHPWAPAGARSQLHHAAARAGVRRRFAPHQLRHAHAVEMSREGVPLRLHRECLVDGADLAPSLFAEAIVSCGSLWMMEAVACVGGTKWAVDAYTVTEARLLLWAGSRILPRSIKSGREFWLFVDAEASAPPSDPAQGWATSRWRISVMRTFGPLRSASATPAP